MSLRHRSLLMLLAVALIWGSGFIATQYAIGSGLSTTHIMALRFSIAALAVGIVSLRSIKRASKAAIGNGLVAGVLLFGAFYTQTAGQGLTTVSNTAFLTSTNVVMIPFLLWGLDRKKPPVKVFALSGLTLMGIGLLMLKASTGLQFNRGDWLILLCAALFAGHIVYLGKFCREFDLSVITFLQLAASAAISLALLAAGGAKASPAQWRAGLLPAVYLGLFSTCLCYYLQTLTQRHVPPAPAGIALSMEGVFGTLFSVILGLEAMRAGMAAGGFLITLSIVLTELDFGFKRKDRKHSIMRTGD